MQDINSNLRNKLSVRYIFRSPAGKRITSLDVLPSRDEKPTEVLISEGTVLDNISVPPAGGCVVSVRVKFDGDQNVLTFPGFHQLFFYGEYAKKLKDFCQLYKLNAKIV